MHSPMTILPPDYPGGGYGPPGNYGPESEGYYPPDPQRRSPLAWFIRYLLGKVFWYLAGLLAVPAFMAVTAGFFYPSETWFVTKLLFGFNDSVLPGEWISQPQELWEQLTSFSYRPPSEQSGPIEVPPPEGATMEFKIYVQD